MPRGGTLTCVVRNQISAFTSESVIHLPNMRFSPATHSSLVLDAEPYTQSVLDLSSILTAQRSTYCFPSFSACGLNFCTSG